MKKVVPILAALLLIFCSTADAQVQNVLDGAYVKEHNATKRVIPYPHLREADVMFAKRIWQRMDMRQKMNHPFYYPIEEIEDRKSLFDVIKHALLVDGSLTAYSLGPTVDDDEFHYPMTQTEIDSLLRPVITQYTEDPDTGERIPVEVEDEVRSEDVTMYEIKEDWLFDKQRSERFVRIIGICPMMEDYDDQGEKRGYKPLFWLYFPECRYVFANADVYNFNNDSQRRTFEDLFQKRMFSSYVVKESNVYDRSISAYARNIDALLESERIKEELFEVEHDLWHY
ncbi:MAG: gliding motility protein GldN [Flavobacteriales bacterium]|nr:gliding motility protein GldN [Flavobacteriales bacterium]